MRTLLLLAVLLAAAPAAAAERGGVAMPEAQDADGAHLVLNGMALRTYSFLGVRIYVAGLYLRSRSADFRSIIDSDAPKLLRFTFLRNVDSWAARRSWRESLQQSCQVPCRLPAQAVERFLENVPAVHAGESSTFLFTPTGLTITMDGRELGRITDQAFARTILSTFIGPRPTAADVKRGLLSLTS